VFLADSDGAPALWLETASDGTRTLNDYNGAETIWPGEDVDAAVAQWKINVEWDRDEAVGDDEAGR
jgi:hypothetical protein